MNRIFAGILVFTAGAVVMIFEISGSRILGPYLGSSLFVWSGLIGVIMASLSAGYWTGGKLSVKNPDGAILALVFCLIAAGILATLVLNRFILRNMVVLFPDKRAFTITASLILFGPVSFLCGVVLPLTIRIFTSEMGSSGKKTGIIFALSSIGSIAGTMLAGFIMLPYLGHVRVMLVTAFISALLAFLVFFFSRSWKSLAISAVFLMLCFVVTVRFIQKKRSYIDEDTMYNRVIIYKATDEPTGKPIQILMVNDEKSSAMYLDNDDLVFEVLRYYRLAGHFYPGFSKTLMIGGSGYAFPKYFLKHYPGASIDVVEIDRGLTNIAKKYFRLREDPRLKIIHEDGRTFLNRNKEKYQVIYMDAYKSVITIPYQLTTIEAVRGMYNSLDDQGIVLANIISTRDKNTNRFLQAEFVTYKAVFPQVLLFSVGEKDDPGHLQNFMLLALKGDKIPAYNNPDTTLQAYLANRITDFSVSEDTEVLTDEYAPVDFYTYTLLFKGQPRRIPALRPNRNDR